MYSLLSYVRGDDHTLIFEVEIAEEKTVATLKQAIKKAMEPAFDHIPADSLVLWNIDVPFDKDLKEVVNKLGLVDAPALLPHIKLSSVFPDQLADKHVYIVVDRPPPSSSTSLPQPPLSDDLLLNRSQPAHPNSRSFPSTPPSALLSVARSPEVNKASNARVDQSLQNSGPIASIDKTNHNHVAHILEQLNRPWHEDEIKKYYDVDLSDFLQLQEKLEEQYSVGRKLKIKLSYLKDSRCIMVIWPSNTHEQPLEHFSTLLRGFYGHIPETTELSVLTNSDVLNGDESTTIPDIRMSASSAVDESAERWFVLVECATSQTHENARISVNKHLDLHPEIIMVVIIDVIERPRYHSPGSNVLPGINDLRSIDPNAFMALCDSPEDREFPRKIRAFNHRWCSIEDVVYHVWLRQPDQPKINVYSRANYASGYFPESMEDVESKINEGLACVNRALQQLSRENDPNADTSDLENLTLVFHPKSSFYFRDLANKLNTSFKRLAFVRFQRYLKGLRAASDSGNGTV